jgi:hypothetical protein
MTSPTDWNAWHQDYTDPGSPLSGRLRWVQKFIDDWLEKTAPAEVRVLSSCAGDGRDLLGVLAERADSRRVVGHLLETDFHLAHAARESAGRLDASIEIRRADAGITDSYVDAVPADLVLFCGIFGNISDDDIKHTIEAASQFCASDARLIWTRHRRTPDLTPTIRQWFSDNGFVEEAFIAPDDAEYSVGVQRFSGATQPLVDGQRLFTFVT